uniref:Argininosuccinate lyase n=2 Tax=Corethron hystrix TaxID=216773 RepID=A0A7S1BCH6_9STRA|mmetsp:Transcript_22112/g.50552  ORF Transcript_22112/g.50552 Transcript_22112/m.50552 type:complete len:471 (+) Transcript_22112:1287-2699(+)|eukprot:CAMPEP_0113318266 /NCGR_PEP_ID=MMETSP0010_2-20120614/12886_1 /TAXON_ID=216773 ORGANISM="Corethron hystrix, Strain 308" /NCGR_SAMPLE_ID=MMETSP0010_2 /ASSEMBLY_ACC=CAM_ASM_000155 /LENGTH=470 /DNA_ID=CAMNT_0000175499 /DNA_START=864 /DNA_END=2276 /DNA_ORIENTATION=+ /assembly_acc=CAM_ASM_000155
MPRNSGKESLATRGGLFGAGGRFSGGTDPIMEKFNESLSFDKRMYDQDIRGSVAYAKAICAAGILSEKERDDIIAGLQQVREEWRSGTFEIKPGDEDIHTANERRLTELIGPAGGKLHTGRSRNDQVATDARLWTVEAERDLLKDLSLLLDTISSFSENHLDVLMAGYTHLQPAQPIRFSHWLMSHAAALVRDAGRLQEIIPRTNLCPLGSGALAGNAFGVDREFLAKELGFNGVTSNSLDAVCDRDFIVDFLFWSTLLLTHLSQFAEDVIINNLLKCITIDDAYATGSSLMPQKKNPDALELLRGKAGIALGRAVGFTATLKGLPRAYNKDLQEDKVQLFDAVDTVKDCLAIATGIVATMVPNPNMLVKALSPEMLATDLADYLVRKGVPFRETHHISGACVRLSEERGISIDKLTLEDLQKIDGRFGDDIMSVWDYEVSVERKNVTGGTAKASVMKQIKDTRAFAATL